MITIWVVYKKANGYEVREQTFYNSVLSRMRRVRVHCTDNGEWIDAYEWK